MSRPLFWKYFTDGEKTGQICGSLIVSWAMAIVKWRHLSCSKQWVRLFERRDRQTRCWLIVCAYRCLKQPMVVLHGARLQRQDRTVLWCSLATCHLPLCIHSLNYMRSGVFCMGRTRGSDRDLHTLHCKRLHGRNKQIKGIPQTNTRAVSISIYYYYYVISPRHFPTNNAITKYYSFFTSVDYVTFYVHTMSFFTIKCHYKYIWGTALSLAILNRAETTVFMIVNKNYAIASRLAVSS